MGYNYDALTDLKGKDSLTPIIKDEARPNADGSLVFRGHTYDEWYELAYDAFESWFHGDDWGRLFEKIAETLEQMEMDANVWD